MNENGKAGLFSGGPFLKVRVNTPALFILGILFGGAVLLFSLWRINSSIWHDEAMSIYFANRDFRGLISELSRDNNFPLYFVMLWGWIKVFGTGEVAVRVLSLIFYWFSIAAVYFLGKETYGKKGGLIASFLYGICPFTIPHIQNARSYSLLLLLVALSLLFFTKAFLKEKSRRNLFLYIASSTLGMCTHPYFMFVFFAQVVFCLFFCRTQKKTYLAAFLYSVIIFAVLWGEVFVQQVNNGASSWITQDIGRPTVYQLVYFLCHICLGQKFNWSFLKTLLDASAIYGLFFLVILSGVRKNNGISLWEFIGNKYSRLFITIIVFSLLVPFLVSQFKPIFLERYGVIVVVPLAVLLAGILVRCGDKLFLIVLCYGLLGLSVYDFLDTNIVSSPSLDKFTAKYLLSRMKDNDILIFTSLSRPAVDYYLKRMAPQRNFVKISYPVEILRHPGWRDIKGMMAHRDSLKQEAEDLAQRIKVFLEKKQETKIWVLYGKDLTVGSILREELDKKFLFKEIVFFPPHWKLFYEAVLVYQNKED